MGKNKHLRRGLRGGGSLPSSATIGFRAKGGAFGIKTAPRVDTIGLLPLLPRRPNTGTSHFMPFKPEAPLALDERRAILEGFPLGEAPRLLDGDNNATSPGSCRGTSYGSPRCPGGKRRNKDVLRSYSSSTVHGLPLPSLPTGITGSREGDKGVGWRVEGRRKG